MVGVRWDASGVKEQPDYALMLELVIGLTNVRVVKVEVVDGVLEILVESAVPDGFCRVCGEAGVVHSRPTVRYADLPFGGRRAVLIWRKYRWECRSGVDPTWTEDRPDIAVRGSSGLTFRASLWATVQVGRNVRSVLQLAEELGVAWSTVMNAVTKIGSTLINDPERVRMVEQIGVDETLFQAASYQRRQAWVSTVTDVGARKVIDVFQGRQRVDLERWFEKQETVWLENVKVCVSDLHEPFRKAFTNCLPNAVKVADQFHVIQMGNRAPDKTRRRLQVEQTGHRGRAGEPLFTARKLMMMGAERIPQGSPGREKLMAAFAAADVEDQLYDAWIVKENVRDIYTFYGDPDGAAFWIDSLILGCKQSVTKEVKAVGRMLKQWREPILAWHTTGASNGPVEGFNQVIKKVKRIAAGFRKFAHYRTRILLATGGCNWALIGA